MGEAKFRFIGSATVILLFALACSPATTPAPSSCTWTIGIMGASSGDFAYFAKPSVRGVQLAVELANESGKLACTLDLDNQDTQGDPKQAHAAARALVDNEDLVACVCGLFSGETLISGDIFSEAGVAMLSTGETTAIRKQGFDTWYRLVAPTDAQGRATGVYIKRALKSRRVAIVEDGQDYSLDIARNVAEALGRRFDGPMIRMTSEELGPDLAAGDVHRRSPDPDAVFFAGYGPQAWELRHSLAIRGIRIPFVTDGGALMAGEARGADARQGFLSCACTDVTKYEDPDTKAFVDAYRERFGTEPTRNAPDAFDGAQIVIEALGELKGAETTGEVRAHVVAYLEAVENHEGTVKAYSWDEKGELAAGNDDVWIWRWNGRRFEALGTVAELAD